ncbi:unnamed protein product [Peniophora sp. CBMAI 1063]|nr:unnamed protein product [Peniophora sp. CBMAI 1063]
MAAVDPTYPLYPIASIVSATLLLLVLLTSLVRRSWNLGVASLCFWFFFENLTAGVNAVIWANNADVKFYVYCDIVSRVQAITSVVKPMATLIITRRLYLIINRRAVDLIDDGARRRNTALEWTLSLAVPLIVAGPLYYIVQSDRFEVDEGFGCANTQDGSILDVLLIWSWNVTVPLYSIVVYYSRVALSLYRHSRVVDRFLRDNGSLSRNTYLRLFALASFDILITLPVGIASIVHFVQSSMAQGSVPFYFGWTYDHTDWEPESVTYAELEALGTSTIVQSYFTRWTAPVLAFVIFGLFGTTTEARATYWRILGKAGGWARWVPALRERTTVASSADTLRYGGWSDNTTRSSDEGSRTSIIRAGAPVPKFVDANSSDEGRSRSYTHITGSLCEATSKAECAGWSTCASDCAAEDVPSMVLRVAYIDDTGGLGKDICTAS